jgi:hypothetical protein
MRPALLCLDNLQWADDETLDAVVDTFNKRGAILLRGQEMEPDDLMAFISRSRNT